MSSATPAPLVDDEAWQLRYEMRFEWLPPRFGVTPAANGWSAFCSDIARLVAMDTRELRGDALHALDNAATCFRELASHRSPLGLAGNEPLLVSCRYCFERPYASYTRIVAARLQRDR